MKRILLVLLVGISVSNVYSYDFNAHKCDPELEKFESIFEKNIKSEITCVQENMHDFLENTRRRSPDQIEKDEFEVFLNLISDSRGKEGKYFLMKAFDLFGFLSNIAEGTLPINQVDDFFSLLKGVNERVVDLINIIDSDENYWHKREQFEAHATMLFNYLAHNSVSASGHKKIDLVQLVGFLSRFMDWESGFTGGIIENRFVKRVFIGGDKNKLSNHDLVDKLKKTGEIFILGFDAANLGELADNQSFWKASVARRLETLIYRFQQDDIVFKQSDVEDFISFIFKEYDLDIDHYNFSELALKFNAKLNPWRTPDEYTYQNILRLIKPIKTLLKQKYVNQLIFEHYKSQLRFDGPVDHLEMPIPSDFGGKLTTAEIFEGWKHFEKAAKKFHFYLKRGSLNYQPVYKRSLEGINFITQSHIASSFVLGLYGHLHHDDNGEPEEYVASYHELREFLTDAKYILKDLDLWSDTFQETLSEIFFMAEMLLINSEENQKLTSLEITEWLMTAFSSYNVADTVGQNLKQFCTYSDTWEHFEDYECVKQYLVESFLEDDSIRRNFKGLYDYYKLSMPEDFSDYINSLFQVHDPQLPVSDEVIRKFVVRVSTVETLSLEHDLDRNGLLGREEIESLWPRFKRLMMTYSGAEEKHAKSAFLYMIKKQKVPSAVQLLWFHMFGKKKDISAKRHNLAYIFQVMGNNIIARTHLYKRLYQRLAR